MVRLLTCLMFISIALTVVIPVALVTTDAAVTLAEPLVCGSGERLVRSGGRNVHFRCMVENEFKRDVDWLPLIMFVPLLSTLGIAMLLGVVQNRRKSAQNPAWDTASGGLTSGFTVRTSSGSQDARVISFDTSGASPGDPIVVRFTTGEGTRVIEFDPDNAAHPVTVRKSKNDEAADADVDARPDDFFRADLFSDQANTSLKEKLQQLQEAHAAGLITDAEFERKKQELIDAL